jgi:RNase P/RNase MRP subunit p29
MSIEITEWNIILHELIGLEGSIISTPDKNLQRLLNISGHFVDETMNTFKIEYLTDDNPKTITVPKHKTSFRFILPANNINSLPKTVDIEGSLLTKRPEDRIKKLAKIVQKNKKKGR